MTQFDPSQWLLTDEDWARIEDMEGGGVHNADNIARAQLIKALAGVEEWLKGYKTLYGRETDDGAGWEEVYLYELIARARKRLERKERE